MRSGLVSAFLSVLVLTCTLVSAATGLSGLGPVPNESLNSTHWCFESHCEELVDTVLFKIDGKMFASTEPQMLAKRAGGCTTRCPSWENECLQDTPDLVSYGRRGSVQKGDDFCAERCAQIGSGCARRRAKGARAETTNHHELVERDDICDEIYFETMKASMKAPRVVKLWGLMGSSLAFAWCKYTFGL